MKRRIEELVNGIYEYKTPEVFFSCDEIRASVKPGEKFFGSFAVRNSEQKKIKGFLYSSDARVACEPRDFSGLEPRISFDVDFTGMKAGDVLEGFFTVCTNMGEKKLPFSFRLGRNKRVLPDGENLTLDTFVKLAKEDYEKAYTIFCSSDFGWMIEKQYPQYEALFRGMKNRPMDIELMEAFLVGTGRKEEIRFETKKQKHKFQEISATIREKLEIVKNGWGYFKIEVTSDAAFLRPEHETILAEDFLGSTFSLDYLIDPSKMHAGYNFGRITLKCGRWKETFEVTAKSVPRREPDMRNYVQKKAVESLYRDYLDFRLKRIPINTWIAQAEDDFAHYEQAGGKDIMVRLYQVQIYFAADQPEIACTLLEKLEQKRKIPNVPKVQGYYQYLTTLYNKDQKYVDYIEGKIQDLYLKNQEEWVLQWVLLYLQENLIQHPSQKLEAIRRQYEMGCRSRVMYLEAYTLFQKYPLLLKKLDDFEIQVLRFICRNDLLDKEIVMQVADLAGRLRRYDKTMYQILCYCHSKYPSKSVVSAICGLLIKGHKTGTAYFNWYEKGVSEGLRLTGLYEYYAESMGKDRSGLLPQMIRMYFSYDNSSLDYEKRAVLYKNIIENKYKDEKTYDHYRASIEKFMVDQLAKGRMNRELACIYQEFLNASMLNTKMAENLSHALFTCEISCESEEACAVAVVHRQLDAVQTAVFSHHTANVQIYTRDACIFIIDREGRWHAKGFDYQVTRLLEGGDMFSMCRKIAPKSPGFLLYFCTEAQRTQKITAEDIPDFMDLLEFVDVQESYKMQLRKDILTYYYENEKDDTLYEHLHSMDLKAFAQVDKGKMVELLVREGMCREAFRLVAKFGPEGVSLGALVRLCSRRILEQDRSEDEMLLYLCYYCFVHRKYDEAVLSYLLAAYDGPMEMMKELWEAGRKFELDTMLLEEKILIVLSFERMNLEDTEKIFESYRRKYGKKILLQAYLNLMSYEYFVKEKAVQKPVFDEIERRLIRGEQTDLVCRLAYLRYCTQCGEKNEQQKELMMRILQECSARHMCFSFFETLEPSVLRTMQLMDRSIIEYRTNPQSRVMLTYTMENREDDPAVVHTEMMHNVYEGIFEKDFTLFYGEKMVYTIWEEQDGRKIKSEPHTLLPREDAAKEKEVCSRYSMINEMCRALVEQNKNEVKKQAKEYCKKEKLAEHFLPVR